MVGLTEAQRAELGTKVAELKVMLDEAEHQISLDKLGNVNWHAVATELILLTSLIHRYYNPAWARMYEAAAPTNSVMGSPAQLKKAVSSLKRAD